MNPYDFVPIDWSNPPERHRPSPHDRFDGVSGTIEGTITAETPVFIFHSPKRHQGAAPFIKNAQNQHIIPGSSLKGLFRNLVETIGNGCFLLYDGCYEDQNFRRINYTDKLPGEFEKCSTPDLCIACRMFGTIQHSNLLLGKVSFRDAIEVRIRGHTAIYTIALMGPKPRHKAFYLDSTECIAGRKSYFHQPSGIQTVAQGTQFNQHIQPVDVGSEFKFSVQFTNLEDVELQTLLYAIVLEPNMRHKLGYGKPAGLGSVRFGITKLTLIDYASRYTTNQKANVYAGNKLTTYLSTETQPFTGDKTSSTLKALRRIWRWNPNDTTRHHYPDQDWFDENPITPISDIP